MSVINVVGQLVNTVQTAFNSNPIVKTVRTIDAARKVFSSGNAEDFITFVSQGRLGTQVSYGASPNTATVKQARLAAGNQQNGEDWRVRIHLPAAPDYFTQSQILSPLFLSDYSLVFPTTPQILLSSMANYDQIQPVHTNYPYHVYESSRIEDITISAEFPVENERDGAYWVAAVHFLRSITKMFYGQGPLQGHPPPRVALSGYGNFIFDHTPVVVKMFNLDLPNAVDYIKVPLEDQVSLDDQINVSGNFCYVPTLSTINVTVAPAYSRTAQKNFNLESFIKGDYIGNKTNGGFI